MTRQLVTRPTVLPTSVSSVETTPRLVLNPILVPNSVVPTFVPHFVTTRHLVLDPITVPTSVVPTFVPHFVTTRHLVLNPIFVPTVTPRTSSIHPTCCLHALDWTVLEPAASVATVVPLVHMQGQSANLCSSA